MREIEKIKQLVSAGILTITDGKIEIESNKFESFGFEPALSDISELNSVFESNKGTIDNHQNTISDANARASSLLGAKLSGFDFGGENYSAMDKDRDNVMAVFFAISNAFVTDKKVIFCNGSEITLNIDNYMGFLDSFTKFLKSLDTP